MIVIRVGISQNRDDTRFNGHSTLGGGNMGNHGTSSNKSAYPMNSIKVHILEETNKPSLDSHDVFNPRLGSDAHMGEVLDCQFP
jgi:hypothetical protein